MTPLFGFFEGALSPSHIIVVIVVGFLLFGKKFPEMGRSLGKGIVEFKNSLKGLEENLESTALQQRPASGLAQSPPVRRDPLS